MTSNGKSAAHALAAVTVIGFGMLGLYAHVEYSGWVLFVGCMWAWAA